MPCCTSFLCSIFTCNVTHDECLPLTREVDRASETEGENPAPQQIKTGNPVPFAMNCPTSFLKVFAEVRVNFLPGGQKRGDVRERPLCGMQRALRMCPVLGCAETASLPVANIAASQNASKSRFAMRDAKTATGKRRRYLQKEPPLPQKGALAKVLSSCSHFQLRHFFKK